MSTVSEPRLAEPAAPARPWWLRPHILMLIAANALPLWGVLFRGWQVFPLMLLYWIENLIVGAVTIVRICRAGTGGFAAKLFTVPFFLVHYGLFCSVHGIFVFALFGPRGIADTITAGPFIDLWRVAGVVSTLGLWIPVLGLALSHVYALGADRDRLHASTPNAEMHAPYGRIVALHVSMLFGGWAAIAFGMPLAALLLLLGMKIGLELGIIRFRDRRAPKPA